MKLLNYSSDNFWELLVKHLSLRQLETSSKIEDDVRFIIEDVKKFGDDKIIQFAKKFDNISLNKNDIKISNLKKLYISIDFRFNLSPKISVFSPLIPYHFELNFFHKKT